MTDPKMMLAPGSAASSIRLAASVTSDSVKSGPPVMLIRMPVAPLIETSSSSGELMACCGRLQGPLVALAPPGSHQRPPHAGHDRPHVGEVDVDQARHHHQIADATHGVQKTLSTIAKASFNVIFMPASVISRSFGMTISASTHLASSAMPAFALFRRCEPSKTNGLVTTPTVSAPSVPRDLGDHRRGARPGTTAHSGGHEYHVGPGQDSATRPASSIAAARPISGFAPAPRPFGQVLAQMNLDRGLVGLQHLTVGVGDDEIDAADGALDHRVDGVAATAADPHDLDDRASVTVGVVVKFKHVVVSHKMVPTAWLATLIFCLFGDARPANGRPGADRGPSRGAPGQADPLLRPTGRR